MLDVENRLQHNLEILKILEQLFKDNPQLRFQQGLSIVDINEESGLYESEVLLKDKFSEESSVTLEKLLESIKAFQ